MEGLFLCSSQVIICLPYHRVLSWDFHTSLLNLCNCLTLVQWSLWTGLFLFQIYWPHNTISKDFLYRDSGESLAFLASSGMWLSFWVYWHFNQRKKGNAPKALHFAKLVVQYYIRFELTKSGISILLLLIMTFFQLLAAFIISFIALMAVAGSHGSLPINFGTPGLVCFPLSKYLNWSTDKYKKLIMTFNFFNRLDWPSRTRHQLCPCWGVS